MDVQGRACFQALKLKPSVGSMEGNFVLRFLLVTVDEQKITSGASTGKIIPLLRGATCGSVSSVGQVGSVNAAREGAEQETGALEQLPDFWPRQLSG